MRQACFLLLVLQLVLLFSKSLLRHPKAKSALSEMTDNTHFLRYLPESSQNLVPPNEIRRHILCSGKCGVCLARS
jgi:2-oxoglutarate dehydrogenase E1 component